MKRSVEVLFYLCLGLIVGTVILTAKNMISTDRVELGPHQTYTWRSGFTSDLNGNYQLESSEYFELTMPNQAPIQSKYQEPEVGRSEGVYVISADLKGVYQVSHAVTIYSLETTQATFVATTGEIVMDIILSILIGLLLFLLLILFLALIS